MPVSFLPNSWKKWLGLVLVFLVVIIVAGELQILKNSRNLPQNTKNEIRNYSPGVSSPPPTPTILTSLPLSSSNHYGVVSFYDNLNGEKAWREGMFTYVLRADASRSATAEPEIVTGVVQNIKGNVFTIAPLPEMVQDYTGPATISVRATANTSFWKVTYTPVDKYISKMTDKKRISQTDVKVGDNLGFRDLGFNNGMITSQTVYDY